MTFVNEVVDLNIPKTTIGVSTCILQVKTFIRFLLKYHEQVFVVTFTAGKLSFENSTTLHKTCLMHCGKTLMMLRKFKNTTQQQLAKKLATTQRYVSELEKQNHFNGAKLEKILNALNSSKEEWEQLRRFRAPSEN